jgi:hypothetical protein
MLLVKNLPIGTLNTHKYGHFYPNCHQAHPNMHPFPSVMISNYYIYSSMYLLFLPFISMLKPRSYKLEIVSEGEIITRGKGNKMN